jgi:hypothetical protein
LPPKQLAQECSDLHLEELDEDGAHNVHCSKIPLGDTHGRSRLNRRSATLSAGNIRFPGFLPEATERIRREGDEMQNQAYFCIQNHNAYLSPPDPDYPADHPRNREVVSSKGCITDDQVAGRTIAL